uniref:Guanine nucleotide-binding protein subunit alpha-14-like n=1 Tax=Hirondellea gigas TaxID=1518452 RepID=A0A2P2I5Y4_9CRUS
MSCPISCYCGMVVKCRCNCTAKENRTPNATRLVYVLLLGAAETGKSTMMRQMKIIHDNGMSTLTLRSYKNHVIRNVYNCLKLLIRAVLESGISWSTEEASQASNVLNGLSAIAWGLQDEESSTAISMALVPAAHSRLASIIWNDDAAQQCWSKANEYNLPDSTAYYLSEVERISNDTYIPTQEDVLRLRLPTKAVAVYDFTHKDWTFQITDVGGQRGERRRWIRLFDGIHAIIFLAALSEYDQFWSDEEEDGINRLELSLRLFRETVRYWGFSRSTFILFLNKVDVLGQKITTSHLNSYFPDYYGPQRDAQRAIKYIKEKFMTAAIDLDRSVYAHETCATDTDRTKFIFTAVRDHILWSNIGDFF